MVTRASLDDVPHIMLGLREHEEGLIERGQQPIFGPKVNWRHLECSVRYHIADEDRGVVFFGERSMIMGTIELAYYNFAYRFASELLWQSAGDAEGGLIFRAFMRWAEDMKCTHIVVSTFHAPPRLERFMERRGFEKRNQDWVRDLV